MKLLTISALIAIFATSLSFARTGDISFDYEVQNQLDQIEEHREPAQAEQNEDYNDSSHQHSDQESEQNE